MAHSQLGSSQRCMRWDRQKTRLDMRRVLGSRPDCGDKGDVGADPDIGIEKMT